MDLWLYELSDLVQHLLGQPENQMEYVILAGVAVVGLLLATQFVGAAARIPNLGVMRRIIASALGLICLMFVWVMAQKRLLPYVETAWLRHAVSYGVPAIACLVIVIPVQQCVYRSSYTAALITFAVSIALTVLLVILTNALLDAFKGGGEGSRSMKERKESVNRFLDE